ncbi:MAG TPA: heavy-metal-associated domain-containing protein [Candidatus Polarisedimenticolia bacterium]|nr:heavy-metal-associated domain-containing protein [Candidatus Polarisedimenticolia bacterium]
MRPVIGTAPLLLAAVLTAPAAAGPLPAAVAASESGPAARDEAKVVLKVRGMTCGSCSAIIREEVRKLDGVVSVTADYEKGTATVTYLKSKVTIERIVETVNKTGFKATMPDKE